MAVLSHELRTPLTPVLTGLSLLERDASLPGPLRERVVVMRRNAELEARLIDDLLDLTRIARGRVDLDRQPVELRAIIERAAEVCRPDIEARRLHFGVEAGIDPYPLHADPARLQQVFWNILKNSIKFTPPGGCVGVRCRREDGEVVLEVNDSGVGIEAPFMDHLFEAFTQGTEVNSAQFGGLGLGLAISKAFVEMHAGTIAVRSGGRDRGTTVTVRLPVLPGVRDASSAHRPVGSNDAQPKARALRILLVEDHGDTADMMSMVLEHDGHSVHTAGDVESALETVAGGESDLLVSDLGLPDGSGHDLLRELRSRGLTLPAIALSGYGQERDVERSREAGFDLHLVKPVDPARLNQAIAALTARRN
jgi:two-component system, chemotaxis family, CheB/CheR fusion protein